MKQVLYALAGGLAAAMISVPACADPVPPAIPKSITLRAPKSIAFERGQVVIVLPQARVTEQIYGGTISSICASTLAGEDWGKLPVREIYVMNEHAAQGYVFEGGEAECREWLAKPKGEDTAYRAGKSRAETCTGGLAGCLGRTK